MLRKVGLTTALLLALPAFANAWTIAAKVGGGMGAITSDRAAGTVQKSAAAPVMGYFKTATNTDPADMAQLLTFTPAAGYKVSTVLVDGVNKGAVDSVSVAMGSKPANHSVVVYYTGVTYTLTATQPAAGGTVTIQHVSAMGAPKGYGPISRSTLPNLKDGDIIRVTAYPNSDYKVTSIAGALLGGLAGENVFFDIAYDHNVATSTSATFEQVAQVKARILVGNAVTSVNGYAGANNSMSWKVGEVIPLDVTKSTGSDTVGYAFAAYNEDKTPATGATFTGTTGVSFANPGKYFVTLTATVGDATSDASTPIINVVSAAAAQSSTCLSCHATRNPDTKSAANTCGVCHVAASKHTYGTVQQAYNNFNGSAHWNSAINQRYTSALYGTPAGYCSNNCHFKVTAVKNVDGCKACHGFGLNADGSFSNSTSLNTQAHYGRPVNTANTCDVCHTGSHHGGPGVAFYASKHWNNSFEYNGTEGSESITFTGGAVDGQIDPNQSWTTKENGTLTTCAYRCHFMPNLGPDKTKRDSETYDPTTKAVVRFGADACTACHDPHKPELAKQVNLCLSCHKTSRHDTIYKTNHAFVGTLTAPDACTQCHNPHSLTTGLPHSNYTASVANTKSYKASYVTPRTECATCHWAGPANDGKDDVRAAWAESGHGNYTKAPWTNSASHDWKNAGSDGDFQAAIPAGDDCVRCHTAAGFEKFINSGLKDVSKFNATDKECEPLACNACHVGKDGSRLPVGAVTTYYNISTATSTAIVKTHVAATFPDAGDSNLCIPCHAGRINGEALVDAEAKGFDFTNGSFQNSHYMAAAGLMYGKVGFTAFAAPGTNVPGTTSTYESTMTISEQGGGLTSTHRKLGTAAIVGDHGITSGNLSIGGPCVTCHLNGENTEGLTRPGAGHSLEIDVAAFQQVCDKCHTGETAIVEEEGVPFKTAMSILQKAVETKFSIEYDPASYPYFFAAGAAHVRANGFKAFGNAKNEGAAFNLNLLTKEPYAYLHARTYTRRLIYDTIDFLDDGLMNLSVGSYLAANGNIGTKPTDASGTTANDAVWQYFLKYNRTSKAWDAVSERP